MKKLFSYNVPQVFSFILTSLFCVSLLVGVSFLLSQGIDSVKFGSKDDTTGLKEDRLVITNKDINGICYVNIKNADLTINSKGTANATTSYASYQCQLVGSGWDGAAKSVYWKLQALVDNGVTTSKLSFKNKVEGGAESEKATLDSSGNLDITGVYKNNTTPGQTITCAATEVLKDIDTKGGIVTAGSCTNLASEITSSSGWTDNGAQVQLTTITDEVIIGATSVPTAKLDIYPEASQLGLNIRMNATPGTPFNIEDSAGNDKFTIDSNGGITTMGTCTANTVLFKNSSNSVTAFGVQNSAGSTVLNVDTTNNRVGVMNASPSYTLDVTGNIRSTTDASFATSSGSLLVGATGAAVGKVDIRGSNTGQVTLNVRMVSGQTANAFVIQNSTPTNVFVVDPNGIITTASVNSASIVDGSIATADIGDGQVTSAKIADGTIATVDIADGAVTTAKIKTATGSSSTTSVGVNMPLNDYSFVPSITCAAATCETTGHYYESDIRSQQNVGDPGNTVGRLRYGSYNSATTTIRWRYVTSSDNPQVWVGYWKDTGEIVATWLSEDPPSYEYDIVPISEINDYRDGEFKGPENFEVAKVDVPSFETILEITKRMGLENDERLYKMIKAHFNDKFSKNKGYKYYVPEITKLENVEDLIKEFTDSKKWNGKRDELARYHLLNIVAQRGSEVYKNAALAASALLLAFGKFDIKNRKLILKSREESKNVSLKIMDMETINEMERKIKEAERAKAREERRIWEDELVARIVKRVGLNSAREIVREETNRLINEIMDIKISSAQERFHKEMNQVIDERLSSIQEKLKNDRLLQESIADFEWKSMEMELNLNNLREENAKLKMENDALKDKLGMLSAKIEKMEKIMSSIMSKQKEILGKK